MSDITIPQPIAPARPAAAPVGATTPTTFSINGQSGSGVLDSLGNVFKTNPDGSQTFMQKLGEFAVQDSIPIAVSDPTALASGAASAAVNAATGSVASAIQRTVFGISLMDGVFIALGLICIIGALYTFEGTRDVLKTATKTAAAAVAA